jgi:branched-chain amino acid transport system substrate-binding protein
VRLRALALAGGVLVVLVVLILALSSNGGSRGLVGDKIAGDTLTLYLSAPLRGYSSDNGRSVFQGAEVGLAAAGDRIGRYRVILHPLNDATVQRAEWDPGQTTENARLASRDPSTIGYLGDFNGGASAVSIPLLNRLGIAQISAGSTPVGLTSDGPDAAPGEPEKYYPTGIRTFARVVSDDAVQAAAQVAIQRDGGCHATFVLDDGEFDGEAAATSFGAAAQRAGLTVTAVQAFQPGGLDYTPLATSVSRSGADCVLISALAGPSAVLLTRQLAALMPRAPIFGTAGLADSTYFDPRRGGLPTALDGRVLLTVPGLGPSAYPPSSRAFFALYGRMFGPPGPYAILGYEAMRLMLESISRATHGGRVQASRSAVVSALFHTRRRASVLGTYRITPTGNISLRRFGVYRIMGGRLAFWTVVGG